MNVKAMAKSKRSHTKHNQPRKPLHLKPTAASVPQPSSSSSNKQPSNPKKGKKEINPVDSDEPARSSLPSNWDRYEEVEPEFVEDGDEQEEEEYEEELLDWSSGRPRVVTADNKSRSADVRVQPKEPRKYPSISNHDFFDDFYQGFAATHGFQSNNIIIMDTDDDFLADDKAATGKEHGQEKIINERQNVKKEDKPSLSDATETVLDLLLDSFSETKFSDSPVTETEGAVLIEHQGASLPYLTGKTADHQTLVPHLGATSRPEQLVSTLNDDLDELLESTSTLHSERSVFQSIENKGTPAGDATHGSPLQPGFPITSSTLDDGLDNLLKETSKFMSSGSTSIR